jgi:hypothetical protein
MDYNNDQIYQSQFPKSNNHLITWRKNDKIKTCDLNKKCMEIIFDIKKNKNVKIINDNLPIINDNLPIIDHLPTGNLPTYETFNINSLIGSTLINNIIPLILFVILLIILLYRK